MDIESPPPYTRRPDSDNFRVFDVEPRRRGERPKLTAYRILVLGIAITFGLSKARLAYMGQSTALNTMDWINGVCAFLLLYWLGIYEKYAAHTAPWFFDVDYLNFFSWKVVDRTIPIPRRD